MHFFPITAGVDDPLFADVEGAVRIELFLRILLEQLANQRRHIPRIAFGRFEHAVGVARGILFQPFVPIDFCRRHLAASGEVPADPAASRVTLFAAAAHFFDFDAGGMPQFERPVDAIQDVAAHVADGAIAEIVPAMPFVRLQIVVIIPVRSRADPFLPMKPGRDRLARRTRPAAAVGPVSPAMGLGHFPDRACPNVFAKHPVSFLAMALVAHLSGHLGLAGHVPQLARFGDIMADRLFAIDVFAQLHRDHRGERVVMIGRGDKDGVDLFADFVKHLPVIGERLKLFRIVPFSFKGLPNDFVPLFIHIDNSEHVFTRNRRQVGLEATPAAADQDAIQFIAGTDRAQQVGACEKPGCGGRASRQGGAFQKDATI